MKTCVGKNASGRAVHCQEDLARGGPEKRVLCGMRWEKSPNVEMELDLSLRHKIQNLHPGGLVSETVQARDEE